MQLSFLSGRDPDWALRFRYPIDFLENCACRPIFSFSKKSVTTTSPSASSRFCPCRGTWPGPPSSLERSWPSAPCPSVPSRQREKDLLRCSKEERTTWRSSSRFETVLKSFVFVCLKNIVSFRYPERRSDPQLVVKESKEGFPPPPTALSRSCWRRTRAGSSCSAHAAGGGRRRRGASCARGTDCSVVISHFI